MAEVQQCIPIITCNSSTCSPAVFSSGTSGPNNSSLAAVHSVSTNILELGMKNGETGLPDTATTDYISCECEGT